MKPIKVTKKMKQAKPNKLGDDLLNLELLVDKLIDKHDLQWGDVFGLVLSYLSVHRQDARENYVDGDHPVFYYGPKENK